MGGRLKLPRKSTTLYVVGFVLLLVAFAYLELTYTRRVESTSMLPTLQPGDLVVIQPVPFDSLKVGNIIVYSPPCSRTGASVIHRIIQVETGSQCSNGQTCYLTKGDNNEYTDVAGGIANGPITQNCYVGKVVFVVPYIEQIATLPDDGNYVIAGLIFLAVIYMELAGRGKTPKPPSPEVKPDSAEKAQD